MLSTHRVAHDLFQDAPPGMMTLQSTWALHLAEGERGKAKTSTGALQHVPAQADV